MNLNIALSNVRVKLNLDFFNVHVKLNLDFLPTLGATAILAGDTAFLVDQITSGAILAELT